MLNKKTSIILSSLLVSASSLFAATYNDSLSGSDVNSRGSLTASSSIGANFVYGVAMNNIFSGESDEGEEIDVAGVDFIFSKEFPTKSQEIKTDFFIQSGFSGGRDELKISNGVNTAKQELTLFRGDVSFGVGFSIEASEQVSFSLRPRLGVSMMNFGGEVEKNGVEVLDVDDTEVGFLYGIGVATNIKFNENHGMMIGVEYMGSTARPEVEAFGEREKIRRQSYINFSVGYRYSF